MISALFIIIASFFNAVSERLTGRHFEKSIFKGLNPCFWNRKVSAQCTTKVIGYPLDAWFCSQLSMIVAIVSAIVNYSPIVQPPVDFFIYCGLWIMNYDVFYKLILRKK